MEVVGRPAAEHLGPIILRTELADKDSSSSSKEINLVHLSREIA